MNQDIPGKTRINRRAFLNQAAGFTAGTALGMTAISYGRILSANDRISHIKNPVAGGRGATDYNATIRGVRKNLILLDFFVYNRRFEPLYQQMRSRLAKRR